MLLFVKSFFGVSAWAIHVSIQYTVDPMLLPSGKLSCNPSSSCLLSKLSFVGVPAMVTRLNAMKWFCL